MPGRGFMAGMLAVVLAPVAALADAEPPVAPFSSHYIADWKTINVGTSDLELTRGAAPGSFVYKWTITARGIFRIVYNDDLIQQSWFNVLGDHVRPEKYRAQEGASSVNIEFDWNGGHAH